MSRRALALLALTTLTLATFVLVTGCAASGLASQARVERASDSSSYSLRRVGVLPFGGTGADGTGLGAEEAELCAQSFAAALAREVPFEVRALGARDLQEIPPSDTFRRGWTEPKTIIALGRRFGLDALVIGDVRRARWIAPQRLDLQVELIAVETGMPLWTASLAIDAGDTRVASALKHWVRDERASDGKRGEPADLYLLSPRLFFDFASVQLARAW